MPSLEWPALEYAAWEKTLDTLHLWTQIVGKTALALLPRENHWWQVALEVTPRGLVTRTMPYHGGEFDVAFDFCEHRLCLRTSRGQRHGFALDAYAVAEFYQRYRNALAELGIEVHLNPKPQEFDDATPFDQDRHHAAYDAEAVGAFHQALMRSDRVLREFRARFCGKCSPVQFFWGSFDLAVTRFSGRRAPAVAGADAVTAEAYSHEVSSCGFWPGDRRYPHAAYYAYAVPRPAGFETAPIRPAGAGWNKALGEYLLDYAVVREAADPAAALLEFCQSSYEAAATRGGWDRAGLERS